MQKRGQGLELSYVIVAVLLLVLVATVLFMWFRGSTQFGRGLEDCVANGGRCIAGEGPQSCFSEGSRPHPFSCGSGKVCCIGG